MTCTQAVYHMLTKKPISYNFYFSTDNEWWKNYRNPAYCIHKLEWV